MDIVSRLKTFMDNYNIAISQFADTCNIPRPTMSQILNGRNKKISDELITKIHLAYPNLSVLWLMFGEGDMLTNRNTQISEASNSPKQEGQKPQQADNKDITPTPSSLYSVPENQFKKNSDTENINTSINLRHSGSMPFSSHLQSTGINHTNENLTYRNDHIDHSHQEIIDFDTNSDFPPIFHQTPNPGQQSNSTTQNSTCTDPQTPIADTINQPTNTDTPNNMILATEPGKQITNIVVFYSDNSFQSFYPLENKPL